MVGKFILLFIVWIGLTNSLDPQELIIGVVIAFVVAKFFTKDYDINLGNLIFKYLKFAPIFIKNLVKSNIEVAKIVLNPKLLINTGVVKLKTNLKSEHDKLILANAITLTPGTITLELEGDELYVHVLNLESLDREVLQKEIVGSMERALIDK
jgi:multicomponent Na+:H+ antiporter subunit E